MKKQKNTQIKVNSSNNNSNNNHILRLVKTLTKIMIIVEIKITKLNNSITKIIIILDQIKDRINRIILTLKCNIKSKTINILLKNSNKIEKITIIAKKIVTETILQITLIKTITKLNYSNLKIVIFRIIKMIIISTNPKIATFRTVIIISMSIINSITMITIEVLITLIVPIKTKM